MASRDPERRSASSTPSGDSGPLARDSAPQSSQSAKNSAVVPLVKGLWLIVDALAILGIAAGIASWYFAGTSVVGLIGLGIAGAMLLAAAILTVIILRRSRATRAAGTAVGGVAPPSTGQMKQTARLPFVISGDSIDTLRALHKLTARTCCQHADGSGKVQNDASRTYFTQWTYDSIASLVAAADLKTTNEFQRLLDRIAQGLGQPPVEILERVRTTIPQWMAPAQTQVADALGATQDPQVFRETLVDACFEHADGRGRPVTTGLNTLLSRLTASQLAAMYANARPKILASTARIVGTLTRYTRDVCPGLELLRSALIDAGRAKLPASQQAEWIVPFIAGLCCEQPDGGGKVDREAARRLFEGMSFQRLGDRLSHVPIRELNGIAQALARIAGGLEEPHPAGFQGFIRAVDDSIDLAAIRLQPRLLEATRLAEVRQVIVEACCECDDASGFLRRRPLQAMLDGVEAERFTDLIADATPIERMQLSQLMNRLEGERRGEGQLPVLQRLREMLSEKVDSDRAEQRAATGAPAERPDDDDEAADDAYQSPTSTSEETAADGLQLTWQHFKRANLVACSPELARSFVQLLDEIVRGGDDGLKRVVRRLWHGVRRDGDRLVVELPDDERSSEWARKRYLADALARTMDRRAVPKLVALFEGDCDDAEYRDTVQPAIARALVLMRDKRAVETLRRLKKAPHISDATRRVIAASKHVARREDETPH